MAASSKYQLTLSLNALNHLGINLYSNASAVLAELVANAWDADAERVDIDFDQRKKVITITDNGHGMSVADANGKFLTVGYARRENGEATTPKFKRPVMGRKGIGKLSIFSIAGVIEVHSVKGGEAHGFTLVLADIEKTIKAGGDTAYRPAPVKLSSIIIKKGTRLTLSGLKHSMANVANGLKKRIARRFSVIGSSHKFKVFVNGAEITTDDRDYFHKIEYLWWYGDESKQFVSLCKNIKSNEERSEVVRKAPQYTVSGWIGSVKKAGDLKDDGENINRVVVLVRGKVAHEDILEEFNEGGVYSKYLIGEISADFLDIDTERDIATSSRQRIIEDDPRYSALKGFIAKELKHIQNQWTTLRNKEGAEKAKQIPEIAEWFKSLSSGQRDLAEKMFGKINQLPLDDDPEARGIIYKQSILAFQSLNYKDKLNRLENISPTDIPKLMEILGDVDEIEATVYHQIVKERLQVIETLHEKLDENALEAVVQKHLFTHLWLLDPSWERATDATPIIEKTVQKEFAKVIKSLSKEERAARIDIKYKTAAGKHIIVELKRPGRSVTLPELLKQVLKYRSALSKCLDDQGEKNYVIEIVCVVGKAMAEWSNSDGKKHVEDTLAPSGARVIMYQELIARAEKAYGDYLENSSKIGALGKLIDSIDTGKIFE